jgi:outer membrane protein
MRSDFRFPPLLTVHFWRFFAMNMSFLNCGKAAASTLLLAMVVSSGASAATAEKAAAPAGPPQKVAVLDMGAALFNSERAKVIDQEIQKQTSDDQSKIRTLAEDGKKLQEKFKKDEAVMSDDEKRKNQEKLQEIGVQYQFLVEKLQKLTQDRRQQFQETYAPNLIKAITEVVQEENYDIVFRSEAVLHYRTGYDITARVTEKLNAQK